MSCDGSCCAAFCLSGSLDQVRNGRVVDGDIVGFMLRPVSTDEATARLHKFAGRTNQAEPTRQYYKCIYWDEDTRLCTAYDNRPAMCKEYPYPPIPTRDTLAGLCGECEYGCDCKGAPLLWEGEFGEKAAA